MKKFLSILTIFSVLLLSFPFAVIAEETTEDPYEAYLYAGKPKDSVDNKVGGIQVWNDEDTLYAQFITEGDWCMTEVHLQVASNSDAIPQTQPNRQGRGGGNPIPGHFAVNETFDECTQESPVYPWDISGMDTDSLVIAAHAVVTDMLGVTGTVYGTRTTGGTLGIYEIDVLSGNVNLLFGVTGSYLNNTTGYTNGLAYDSENNVLYFTAPRAVNVVPTPLWSYVPGEADATKLCDLPGSVVGASWYDGHYYYIAEKTNDLMKVTDFGTCATKEVYPDFADGSFTFGDIAISQNGMLYGSTRVAPQQFFSIDMSTGVYDMIEGATALDLQLAYAPDGKLYGVNHATGKFYEVDETTGMTTLLVDPVASGFSDLASGALFVPQVETAWAGEVDFPGANWARYFTYKVTQPEPEPEWHLMETLLVSAKGGVVNSSTLESGKLYQLKASGTFTYNNAGDWADAEWYLKNGVIVKGDTEGSKPYVLDVSIDGYSTNTDWGDYQPSHVYFKDISGSDDPLSFSIYDSAYGDNNGSITVEIYEWY